jgi:hypothetical protein
MINEAVNQRVVVALAAAWMSFGFAGKVAIK